MSPSKKTIYSRHLATLLLLSLKTGFELLTPTTRVVENIAKISALLKSSKIFSLTGSIDASSFSLEASRKIYPFANREQNTMATISCLHRIISFIDDTYLSCNGILELLEKSQYTLLSQLYLGRICLALSFVHRSVQTVHSTILLNALRKYQDAPNEENKNRIQNIMTRHLGLEAISIEKQKQILGWIIPENCIEQIGKISPENVDNLVDMMRKKSKGNYIHLTSTLIGVGGTALSIMGGGLGVIALLATAGYIIKVAGKVYEDIQLKQAPD